MARFLSQEQNGVGVTSELSLLEERDHLREESRWLRISPGTGYWHAPAITSCLCLLLQTQLYTWGQWDLTGRALGRWPGTQGYSCVSCAIDLFVPVFGVKPKGSYTHLVLTLDGLLKHFSLCLTGSHFVSFICSPDICN